MKLVIAGLKSQEIKEMLSNEKYNILDTANDGFDVLKLCRSEKPDLLITEIDLEFINGISLSKILSDENPKISILFIVDKLNKYILGKLLEINAKGVLKYPFEKEILIGNIEISHNINCEINKILKEKKLIEQKYEDRKVIDKAKGLLMVNEKLTEEESYSKIRKISMQKRVTIREICEYIIISNNFK
ncbi:MAG: ANTAR domain-containing protein [Peptostreptococcaceae bacterium]